jgi:hypothetical protein
VELGVRAGSMIEHDSPYFVADLRLTHTGVGIKGLLVLLLFCNERLFQELHLRGLMMFLMKRRVSSRITI